MSKINMNEDIDKDFSSPYTDDAAVSEAESSTSDLAVLPYGRFLRALL
jgi:hypothetical protein